MLGARLLAGEHVFLDALERSDIETFGAWRRDLDLLQYLVQDPMVPKTIEDATDWYEAQRKDDSTFSFGIRLRDDGRLIGTIGLFSINWRIRKCVFGIVIGDAALRGKGYGTEATRLALRYAFLELNMNRVELNVYAYNESAIRVYERVGFKHEGRLRDAIYRDGRYYDEIVMAILRNEWTDDSASDPPNSTKVD